MIHDTDKLHFFGGVERYNLIAFVQGSVCPRLIRPDQAVFYRSAEVDLYALQFDLSLLPPAGLATGSPKQLMNVCSVDPCTGSANTTWWCVNLCPFDTSSIGSKPWSRNRPTVVTCTFECTTSLSAHSSLRVMPSVASVRLTSQKTEITAPSPSSIASFTFSVSVSTSRTFPALITRASECNGMSEMYRWRRIADLEARVARWEAGRPVIVVHRFRRSERRPLRGQNLAYDHPRYSPCVTAASGAICDLFGARGDGRAAIFRLPLMTSKTIGRRRPQMTRAEFRTHVAAWRALPAEEKTWRRRATVVDEVVGSMRMEREPVSAAWEQRARAAQRARLAR